MSYVTEVMALSPIYYWRMSENNTITSPHTYDFTGTDGTDLLETGDWSTGNSSRLTTISNNKMLCSAPDGTTYSSSVNNNLIRGNVDITCTIDAAGTSGSGSSQVAGFNVIDLVTGNRSNVYYRESTNKWNIVVYDGGTSSFIGGTTSFSSGTDAKIRAVMSGSTCQIYIDDVLRRTETYTDPMTADSASVLYFGNNIIGNYPFTVDDLTITGSSGISGVWGLKDEINGYDSVLVATNTASNPGQDSLLLSDPLDKSILFDQDGYFRISDRDNLSINNTGQLAVSFLFKTPDTTDNQGLISKGNGTFFEWEAHVFLDEMFVRIVDSSQNIIREEKVAVVDDTVYHVVINFTGYTSTDEIEIYLDGVKSNSLVTSDGTKTYSNTSAPMNIGVYWAGVADFFLTNGYLDEVALFSSILSESQIEALYLASLEESVASVQMFVGLSSTTYKFWNTYET